jgi:hypothetical protein
MHRKQEVPPMPYQANEELPLGHAPPRRTPDIIALQ